MKAQVAQSVVVVSRRWRAGQMIQINVHRFEEGDGGISVTMSLEEFITALAQEAGSPALLLTEAGLLERLRGAAERVVEGMKAETARVM